MAGGMGGIAHLGIPYQAVESALRLRGTSRREWPALFADLRVMESAYLSVKAEAIKQRAQSRGR